VLDFKTEPSFECGNNDASYAAFVSATRSIGGWDAIEEYMACGLFPLSPLRKKLKSKTQFGDAVKAIVSNLEK
jgi:hypothetical protein